VAKSSLDYFPLACSFEDKIELIEAEFGLRGLAIIVKLYQKIYGEFGYYCEWNDEVALLFSRKACGLPEGDNVVSEVIKAAIKREIFSEDMFHEYGILTSAGIQKRYFEAVKRRSEIEVEKAYLLLNASQIPNNVNINQKNVYRNEENVCRNQQSKVEESKVNKRKGNINTLCPEPENPASVPPVITIILNTKEEFPFYQSDIDQYSELYPAVDVLQEFRKMKGWCMDNPSRRKTKRGIRKFVNSWLSRAQDRSGGYRGQSGQTGNNFNLEDWGND